MYIWWVSQSEHTHVTITNILFQSHLTFSPRVMLPWLLNHFSCCWFWSRALYKFLCLAFLLSILLAMCNPVVEFSSSFLWLYYNFSLLFMDNLGSHLALLMIMLPHSVQQMGRFDFCVFPVGIYQCEIPRSSYCMPTLHFSRY